MFSVRNKKTGRSTKRTSLAALLCVFAVAAVCVTVALAANGPSTPTITANPSATPNNSATETLTFSSSGATSYQCSLNGSAFQNCTSPKTYGSAGSPQAQGSYIFQVKAADNKGNTATASYSWVVERTAP